MESPFASANTSVVLYLEPYLNTYYKSYQNIITLSAMPTGPLAQLVSSISSPKLSPFQESGPFSSSSSHCTFILQRYPTNQPSSSAGGRHSAKNTDFFMGAEDIPSVFSYLQQNGYIIDTSLTKMLFKSNINVGGNSDNTSRKMICMIQYAP
jgi:hypothetical protein